MFSTLLVGEVHLTAEEWSEGHLTAETELVSQFTTDHTLVWGFFQVNVWIFT